MNRGDVFALDRSRFNGPLGATVAGALFIPLVVLAAFDEEVYWLFPVEGVDGGRLERGGVGASVPG
jgi:hypothetical protein